MKSMMDRDVMRDYVIATGKSHSLEHLGRCVFEILGLNWDERVIIDSSLIRKDEIVYNCGDAELARTELSWMPSVTLVEMLEIMVSEEQHVINTMV